MNTAYEWKFQALTDLWTGDANGRGNRSIGTGLLGSVRWWLEVVVRGLGGQACDPSKTNCDGNSHCVACELFGCTGWARKFRFDVLSAGGTVQQKRIKKGMKFLLRFTPLRPIANAEWTLLDLTLRLISEYGAIGGKTVYKPSDENGRAGAPHHRDYGLVKILDSSPDPTTTRSEINLHIASSRWSTGNSRGFAWASLKNGWCADGRSLSRKDVAHSSYNRVLGRKENKSCKICGQSAPEPKRCSTGKPHQRYSEHMQNAQDEASIWLAGGKGESKKVFSFKDPARTFGFVNGGSVTHDTMRKKLSDVWEDTGQWEFITGEEILRRLMRQLEDR